MLKSILMRGLRVLLYSVVAGVIAFAMTHGQELFVVIGIPVSLLSIIWPTLAAVLVAADKAIRLKLDENK